MVTAESKKINLVIVESPAKTKTIEKYLGKNYKVIASVGHIRDLTNDGKGGLGIDVENNFNPSYLVDPDKKKVVKEIKNLAKKANKIFLATDPDREGEAIAWHVVEAVGLSNKNISRNEGSTIDSGQKLWKRAKKIIPGGNMLLSKRPEMFLPNNWPAYYKKAKGCEVWDLDDNRYVDMSIMGIGTCSLGYANPDVNKAVKTSIEKGSFSTFFSQFLKKSVESKKSKFLRSLWEIF